MSLFLAVLTTLTPISYAATAPTPTNPTVEAAAGRGDFTTDQRLVARLTVCFEAIKNGVPPSKLTEAMDRQNFGKLAKQETLDVCSAFATGIELGKTLNPKATA